MQRNEILTLVVQSIKNFLSSPERLETYRAKNCFVRKRLLSMLHVILFLFYSAKTSLWQNIASIRLDLPEISFPKVSKQAISKARQGISPALFQEMYRISVDLFYENIGTRKTWHGLHVFAVDGTKLQVPNTKSNFKNFGKMFSAQKLDYDYSQATASIIYDVLEDYIVHASINRFLCPERNAAMEHLNNLIALDLFQDSVVVFDRGYYSERMFRFCVDHGITCLMRIKADSRPAKHCNGDVLYTLPGNQEKGTEAVTMRVVQVILDNGTKEYLATTLFDPAFSVDMFRELYHLRWPVETKYLELKERFQIECFTGATTTSIIQEFYLNLLLSNIASLVKNHVDEMIDADKNPVRKHRYQSNRSFIIGQIKKRLPKIICGNCDLTVLDDLIEFAYNVRSQIQPDRSSKRRIKKGRTRFNNRKVSF